MTRNASNDGRSFERSLQQVCRLYAEAGRAYFEKVEPPTRTIGGGFNRKVLYMANPFLDFVGTVKEWNGRAAMFEAKSTSKPVLPCGDHGGFSQSQREAMAKWRQHGAACWLLWEYQGEVRLWFQSMVEAGLSERASLLFEDGLTIKPGKGFLFWDFLATVADYQKIEA